MQKERYFYRSYSYKISGVDTTIYKIYENSWHDTAPIHTVYTYEDLLHRLVMCDTIYIIDANEDSSWITMVEEQHWSDVMSINTAQFHIDNKIRFEDK